MSLVIEAPSYHTTERDYILDVILKEFLGLSWRREVGECLDVRITLEGQPGEVLLPDKLFSMPDADWLQSRSMPHTPLQKWDTTVLGFDIVLVEPSVPVLYGEDGPWIPRQFMSIHLPVDIFGSAFFMLSRYEEMVNSDRDEHDRFPAWASLAYKEGFLERPIVDEYVEILWATMQYLWPGLERKQRKFSIKVSHDVDSPSLYAFKPWATIGRMMAGHLLKRRDFKAFVTAPYIKLATRTQLLQADPCNTFDWLMDVSEANNLRSAFYFICGHTDLAHDADYEPEHPVIRQLMRRIHQRGHEIGLHPSYSTFQKPELIKQEAVRLKRICAEEGIEQQEWGGRMHYLRCEQPTTLRAWNAAGMSYDSTLGYADRPGFRCGTCHEYPAFDPVAQEQLALRIRPLVVMECTVIDSVYLGLGITQAAEEKMRLLKERCRQVGGSFTLLWHNSNFRTAGLNQMYLQCLGA
jgi:hypothetical protein